MAQPERARIMGREVIVNSVDNKKPARKPGLDDPDWVPRWKVWLEVLSLVLYIIGAVVVEIATVSLWGMWAGWLVAGLLMMATGVVLGSS